jgi:hypothetical protein
MWPVGLSRFITADGRTVDAQLKPEHYAQATQHGFPFSMSLALGSYSVRLAVETPRRAFGSESRSRALIQAEPVQRTSGKGVVGCCFR